MREDTVAFTAAMAARFPLLSALYDDHVGAFGETFPHVFFGDVTRFVTGVLCDGCNETSPRFQEVKELLTFLESAYIAGDEADDGIRNLIAVSFLEYLMFPANAGEKITREMLGPALKAQLVAMESWHPSGGLEIPKV